ncbi:SPOC like C-terminal domain-containing protein [Gymnopilus junonius]|uniref:ATP-dependent DNA helicase II subunit 2 n=1 Tax=Gymnopilus junonius TaxID=109634 RepID=A0A9P5NN20_GYMJU|nr:SPOC like C-terminal domain-containing protein [Gymnopilus junonius]
MPAERAGYTVTMFVIDTSPSMANIRSVEMQNSAGETTAVEMSNLQWSLQYVKLKIQEMIFNGRKTDQCGVIVFGAEDTKNIIHAEHGGYDNVLEYIPIGQPNASTIAKIDALEPSTVAGDSMDALIVAIETQARYLASKKTWTRKITIVTDGESPIEVEDWEATVTKMDALNITLVIVGVDFDDEYMPYTEPNKSHIKRANEEFYKILTSSMHSGDIGNIAYAIRETAAPEVKVVKSALLGTVLRIGDVETRADEAIELSVKASKATAMARPKSWKKFALRESNREDEMQVEQDKDKAVFAQLKMKTEYFIDRNAGADDDEDDEIKVEEEELLDEGNPEVKKSLEKIEKEELVRGFKYGTTYAPCPDGQFPRLQTRKGIDICGFFPEKNFRRELSMGDIQYIWADPSSPQQQVALSSIVQAMADTKRMAIARWVSRDGMDPKMGVLTPVVQDNVHFLLWSQMPFADDVRKYTFASLDTLINKKGQVLKEHPYLPTEEQLEAMDKFVDAMDLVDAGDKDEEGNRTPWFDPSLSFNPAIHRVKQAMFHAAVVKDVVSNPLPPPHPETLKYFDPPKRVLKRARAAVEECKAVFKVKEGKPCPIVLPKKVARAKVNGHEHANDEDDDLLLLDRKQPVERTPSQMSVVEEAAPASSKGKAPANAEDSATESESEEELLLEKKVPSTPAPKQGRGAPLPTPARSVSPMIDAGRAPGRIIGNTYPLKDFQKNLAQGDVVSKAVEDLSAVIAEVVMKPFSSRRTDEMLQCMTTLRKTCLEEDEIDAWNAFIRDLKSKCLSRPGNPGFWQHVKKVGRDLGLISKQEAKKQGGDSDVSENEAGEFIS